MSDETQSELAMLREEVRLLRALVSGLRFNQSSQAAYEAEQALNAFYCRQVSPTIAS